MHMFRRSIFCIIICWLSVAIVSAQKKSTLAEPVDLFGDLPINDPTRRSVLEPGESPAEKIKQNIRVTGSINKPVCFIGEPVLLSFKLMSGLKSSSDVLSMPALDGFMAIKMDPDNSFPRFKKIGGIEYNVFTVRQMQLIPDRLGDITIGAIEIANSVQYSKGEKKMTYSGNIASNPVKLKVMPLPDKGVPAGFNGAIGKFQVNCKLMHDTIPAGETNMLVIEITGEGNFYSLKQPVIQWPSGFHNFDAVEKTETDEKVFPVKGKRVITIPFVADQQGSFTIPAIQWSYFDPAIGKYVSVISDSLPIKVEAPLPVHLSSPDVPVSTKIPGNTKRIWPWIFFLLLAIGLTYLIRRSIVKYRKNLAAQQSLQIEKENLEKEAADFEKNIRQSLANLNQAPLDREFALNFKQSLVAYLQWKINKPAALPEDIIHHLLIDNVEMSNKVKAALQECDLLLYADIPPDVAIRNKLINLLHEIVD